MSRRRRILLAVVAVALLMATIHFSLNGFGSLASLNPHNR